MAQSESRSAVVDVGRPYKPRETSLNVRSQEKRKEFRLSVIPWRRPCLSDVINERRKGGKSKSWDDAVDANWRG